jgi:dTDP-4-amino-4,6-dideoxygalactose transaminase
MPTAEQVLDFVEQLENPDECVFMITHIGGWINPDIEKIAEICKQNNISLIEDCAHSLGSTLDGNHSGLYGDAGVYSLYATKAVPVGEGGIVVSNNSELSHQVQKFSMYDRFDQKLDLGVNIRMSEVNALLTYSVLNEIDEIISNKYTIADKFMDACEKKNLRYIHPTEKGQRSNFYKFTLLAKTDNPIKEFEQITQRTSPVYDYALGEDLQKIAQKHICLPIWYKLEDEKIENVIEEIDSL